MRFKRLRLAGLNPGVKYRISGRDYECYGDELMNIGFILSDWACGNRASQVPQGDFQARVFVLDEV